MSTTNTPPPATNVASMPKRSHHAPLNKNTSLGDAFEHPEFLARIKQAIPRHMTPDRMLSVFIQAVKKTPKLREVDTMSLLGAFISVASVGLEPNTALQHAHLIPFEKNKWNPTTRTREKISVEVNIIFGYQGLLELVYRSGLLRSVHADVVWKADEFDFWYGSGSTLKHKPVGGLRADGEIPLWGYTHANMKGDAEMFEVMPMADILRVRDSTQAYSSALSALDKANKEGWKPPASYTEAPWVKHFVPMAKKTVFRAAAKWLPKSIELAAAIQLDEAQERGSIPYGQVIEGTASILDGGLDAITDEYTDRQEVDLGGAFSMQDSRQTVDAGRQDAPPPPPRQQQQPPTAHTAQQAQAGHASGFSAYLLDEWGEVAGDEHTDAIGFAMALRALVPKANSLSALLEANAEGIEDASAANSSARSMMASLTASPKPETTTTPAQPGTQVVQLTTGRQAWPLYVKALKEALDQVPPPFFTVWTETNLPNILKAPDQQRLSIVKAVTERAKSLGVPVPDGVMRAISVPTQAPAPAAEPVAEQRVATMTVDWSTIPDTDPDKRWGQQTVAEVKGLQSIDEIRKFASNKAIQAKMSIIRQRNQLLWDIINNGFAEAMQAFAPPAEDGGDAGGPPEMDPEDPGYIDR